jgi:hypothetical protein
LLIPFLDFGELVGRESLELARERVVTTAA